MCCEAYAGMWINQCDRFAPLLHFGEREFRYKKSKFGRVERSINPPLETWQNHLRTRCVVGNDLPSFSDSRRIYSR
jgi:hypothetical protein